MKINSKTFLGNYSDGTFAGWLEREWRVVVQFEVPTRQDAGDCLFNLNFDRCLTKYDLRGIKAKSLRR
jgi:hypothetical protein